MGEFCDEPWALTEVSRLRELRLVAVERRAQALLDLGRPQAVIADLEAETVASPLRERLWCLLALALYRTGRQADALAVVRNAGDTLTKELGVPCGPELRALEDDILRQVESLTPAPPSVVLESVEESSQVLVTPAPAQPAVRGREGVLGELVALAGSVARRGVGFAAVSGEPGIGKTFLLEALAAWCVDAGHVVGVGALSRPR
ncbi:BTAD domain-containing putative transcriptional regulator, partial [Microbispora sp. GKU 823]|uniref:BTAD domain-containing putative transcriptional regulator n=1 Tax=Microbispora sp. GKU 823 TaxID=1652100 RepID=UPI0009C7FDFD